MNRDKGSGGKMAASPYVLRHMQIELDVFFTFVSINSNTKVHVVNQQRL
jgi:hypothetical protein